MKLVSFIAEGLPSYGLIEGDVILDAGKVLGEKYADLKALLTAGALPALRGAIPDAPKRSSRQITLLPAIPNPTKIFCIGHNYEDHRLETARAKTTFPAVFLRFADSQVAHEQSIMIPEVSLEIDFEGELAVVIGTGGRFIARKDALSHVAGYSCYNDVSVRDWQRHTTQFTPGKNFPTTGAFGPWLVTADEIADPQVLELTTRLNGEVVQHAMTAQMIFPVDEIIEYCSSFTPLYPGDVIVSGTPGGVGVKRTPPLFMKAGDVVEVDIQDIGILRNHLVQE